MIWYGGWAQFLRVVGAGMVPTISMMFLDDVGLVRSLVISICLAVAWVVLVTVGELAVKRRRQSRAPTNPDAR